ncbi:hypothetical protein BGZ65_007142, partial [Modicella reniformis]
ATSFINENGVEKQVEQEGRQQEYQQEDGHSQSADSSATSARHPSTSSSARTSSTDSNGSLSSAALANLRSAFEANCHDFKGEPWTLPSGETLDDLLREHAMTLPYESTLHSCIIGNVEEVIQLAADPRDKEALQQVLGRPRDDTLWTLPEVEERYLRLYDKSPAAVQTMLKYGCGGVIEGATAAAKAIEEEEAKKQTRRLPSWQSIQLLGLTPTVCSRLSSMSATTTLVRSSPTNM